MIQIKPADTKRILRELRTSAGLTQAALGKRLGMSVPGVSKIETGDRGISAETMVEWVEACGCFVLVEDSGNPPLYPPNGIGQDDLALFAAMLARWPTMEDQPKELLRAQMAVFRRFLDSDCNSSVKVTAR